METIELNVEPRVESGKGAARKIRAAKQIPGVFYGPHQEKPLNLAVDQKQFMMAKKTAHVNSIFKMNSPENKGLDGKLAMIKEIQVHPVKDSNIHVDFYEVKEGEAIKIKVPLVVRGKAKGVKEGGILQQIRRELRIECLPNKIPGTIEIDVTNLEVNDSVHVSDLSLPDGVKAAANSDFTVVVVVPPEKEDTKQAGAVEAAGAAETESEAAAKAGEETK